MAESSKYPDFDFASDPDIRKLQEFLLELREILDDVIKNPRPAVAGRHHKRLQAAWTAAEPRFSSLATELDQPQHGTKLENVGLKGDPLDLKLGMYHQARDEYLDYGTAQQGQSEPKSWWPNWRKLFGGLMKTGNVILGSTASEIPGGEYVKEMAESVALGVEMAGDNEEIS